MAVWSVCYVWEQGLSSEVIVVLDAALGLNLGWFSFGTSSLNEWMNELINAYNPLS